MKFLRSILDVLKINKDAILLIDEVRKMAITPTPKELAKTFYKQMTEIERNKMKNNLMYLNNNSLFSSLKYDENERNVFIKELFNLLKK